MRHYIGARLLVLLGAFALALCQSASASNLNSKWSGYLDVLGFPGADGTVQRSDLFIPLLQGPETLSYLNLRNEMDEDGFAGFSAGMGLRHQNENWIIGGYGYIDWRESDFSGGYRQYSAGVELLNEHWNFRLNGYLPEDLNTQHRASRLAVDPGAEKLPYVLVHGERNLAGYDGEIGTRLGEWGNVNWGDVSNLAPKSVQVWAHIGGYNYVGDKGFDDVPGIRGRLEVDFDDLGFAGRGSRLTLGVEAHHDEIRDTEYAVRLQLRVPLDSSRRGTQTGADLSDDLLLDPLDRRMAAPVVRWPTEVVATDIRTTPAYNLEGEAYSRYFEANSRAELDAFIARRNSEDEILFISMRGDTGQWDMTDFETAGNGVTYALAGIATPVSYDDPFGSGRIQTGYTPPGVTPVLQFDEAGAADTRTAFAFRPGDHINGWSVDASGYDHGISISDVGDYYITNSEIFGATDSGINANGGGVDGLNLYVRDSELRDNGGHGLALFEGAKLHGYNLEAVGNIGSGLHLEGAGSRADLYHSFLSGNQAHGLSIETDAYVSATNVISTDNSKSGARIVGVGATLDAIGGSYSSNTVDGLRVESGGELNATDGLIATQNVENGLTVTGTGSSATLTDSVLTHSGVHGINVLDAGHVLATNVTADNNTGSGAYIVGTGSKLEALGGSYSSNTVDGLRLESGGLLAVDGATISSNDRHGVFLNYLTTNLITIKNSHIHHNIMSGITNELSMTQETNYLLESNEIHDNQHGIDLHGLNFDIIDN